MSLSIRTNVASLNTQRNLSQTQNMLETSMSRLSSGMRITKASDDAAGLGISTNLEAQIRSYNQAARNANDGISLVQTAEGALNEVSNILSRMRELATQAASDSTGADGRASIGSEITSLVSELDRIGLSTNFNGKTLLDGSANVTIQVGIGGNAEDKIAVDMSAMKIDKTSLAIDALDVSDNANADTALGAIDTALKSVSGYRSDLGAYANRFQSVVNTVQTAAENLSAADSRIRDVDVAAETSQLARAQVLAQAGISVLAQANQLPQMALKLLG